MFEFKPPLLPFKLADCALVHLSLRLALREIQINPLSQLSHPNAYYTLETANIFVQPPKHLADARRMLLDETSI